ncbi:MAG: P-loop containing nucleoside triphosphate hydrolase protein [Benniella sp.]|nr:MAG: P-loop containing nucleoside triphosphate hydrolase protein [Benniella sp.]
MSSLPQDAISQCQTMFGVTPKAQQLEVVECIGRGQDVILIAGCGWGKTLVYFLPLVLWQDRIVLIISPLKALMKEQCQKLQDLGISSISLDGDSVNGPFPLVLDRLAAGTYRAVFMTPELIVGSKRVKDLWDRHGWNQRLLAVVVDEAHCISTWGKEFRTAYGDIGDLRSKVLPGVAFVAVSATLPHQALKDVKEVLRFREGHVHIVNVGNDRPNIKLEVWQMKYSQGLNILNFLTDFKKTIVYCQTILQSIKATAHLRALVGPADASKIAPYHALFSSRYKERVMEEFNRDRIRLLFATEAVGMGCDLDNVVRVVQFKLPSTILSLVQRLGRAARDPLLQGFGILIVPPEQTIDDPDLQRYIEAKGCRRRILDEVFGNPISTDLRGRLNQAETHTRCPCNKAHG